MAESCSRVGGAAADVRLLLKWGVQQIVHRRRPLVTRDEALAEVPCEVVVGRGGPCLDNAADRARELLLHLQPGKHFDNRCHLRLGYRLVAEPAPIEPDAPGTQRDLGLLVKAYGR